MTAEDIIRLVQTVGFPIAMCAWFALRLEKKLDKTASQLATLIGLMSSANQKKLLEEGDAE